MGRWWQAAVAGVALLLVASLFGRDLSQASPGSPPAAPRAGPERTASGLAGSIESPEESVPARSPLIDSDREWLATYRTHVDPTEIASSWTLGLVQRGFKRVADHSRPGRTVQEFRRTDGAVVLAVGRTLDGAFVSLSIPDPGVSHWSTGPDTVAPPELRALLPPPPVAGDPSSTTRAAESPVGR